MRLEAKMNETFNERYKGTNREIRTTQTGMTITKIEIGMTIIRIETGSITEGDQRNTNITGTNTKLKSSLNSQTKM